MKKISKITKKNIFFLIFALLSVCFSVLIFYFSLGEKKPLSFVDFPKLAEEVVQKCRNAKYKPDCYDKQIPSLMAKPNLLSMEDAFKVAKEVQKQVNDYGFCHVLGHKIASYETQKDPSKWKEVIARCPSGTCSNGCIHGAFQEKFRADSLPPDQVDSIKNELLIVCRKRPEWNPSGIEQGSCYHALGHLNMYLTNADIPKSISLCKELAFSESGIDYTNVCFDGVYMQIFQPLEPEDYALVAGKVPAKENLVSFCSSFDKQSYGSCWNESWPLFSEELKNARGAMEYCSQPRSNEDEKSRCFSSLFYRAPIQFRFDSDKSLNYCKDFPESVRGMCFAQAAQRYVQSEFDMIDKAIDFCQKSIQYDPKESCFEELAIRAEFNFQKGSKEFNTMCSKLPVKWQNQCLQPTNQPI